MRCREYGRADGSPTIVVLHGGPGAPGSAGGLAHLLAAPARVLEPWQESASVDGQISELLAFLDEHRVQSPVLVGHSWGAMLALAFAAAHPSRVAALALVGCGTFDLRARDALHRALGERLPPDSEGLPRDARLALIERACSVDPLPADPLDDTAFDDRASAAAWSDMLRLQADGTYPRAFARITAPVLMVHGAADPHPAELIRASLAPHLPQLEFHLLARCGHYPWRERAARDAFSRRVRAWIARRAVPRL